MEEAAASEEKRDTLKSWMIIVGIAGGFLIWGLFLYFAVGDKGTPVWDFGVIEDIPGQSPYSTSSPRQFPGLVRNPLQSGELVQEQHVDEPPGIPAPAMPAPVPPAPAELGGGRQ